MQQISHLMYRPPTSYHNRGGRVQVYSKKIFAPQNVVLTQEFPDFLLCLQMGNELESAVPGTVHTWWFF